MKEKHEIRLLKNSKTKDGYTYHNLYLQIDGGDPIAIRLSFETRKLKNFLLAVSEDCEISTKTIVAVKTEQAEETCEQARVSKKKTNVKKAR